MEEIQQVSPNTTALNAEHYQTFEMAKANDDVLGGDDIAQIRSYAAYARAQAQAIHKTIAATNGIDDVAAIKAEATETAQTFAKVGIYADQRIGEILRELPTKQGARNDITSVSTPTKVEAEKQAGIGHATAIDLQKMAANPEVVEAVIAKAKKDGRVVSRKQVLDAINEKKRIERELQKAAVTKTNLEMEAESLRQQLTDKQLIASQRDAAIKSFEELVIDNESMETEIASLKRQLSERPKPEVIEREVEVVREVVPDEVQERVSNLEHENERLNREYQQMWHKKMELDKKLEQANELLGEKERTGNAQRDIEHLTMQINRLLQQHGGKVWAFDQFYRVDEGAQQEFAKAITNLAAFAQNLSQMIQERETPNGSQ